MGDVLMQRLQTFF